MRTQTARWGSRDSLGLGRKQLPEPVRKCVFVVLRARNDIARNPYWYAFSSTAKFLCGNKFGILLGFPASCAILA